MHFPLLLTWFKANKLTLHHDKTKLIIFHPSRKKINSSNLTICVDNSTIESVDHAKFLAIIHKNLLWQPHIKAVLSKIYWHHHHKTETISSMQYSVHLVYCSNTSLSPIQLDYLGLHSVITSSTSLLTLKKSS